MTMNGAVLPIMAFYIVAAEEQGVRPEQLSGTIQNDILKEFMVRNTYIYPPAPSMRIVADIFALHRREDTQVQLDQHQRLSHAGGRRDRRAGARVHARRRPRVPAHRHRRRAWISTISPARFSFFFGIGMDHFTEVAKLRAARLLWSEDRERVPPEEPEDDGAAHPLPDVWLDASPSRTRSTTSRARPSRRSRPCSAARSRCTRTPWTRPWRSPRTSRRRSRATPSSFLQRRPISRRVIDLVGRLLPRRAPDQTRLARRAWQFIQEVESLGGMVKAIENGLPKLRIEEAAARKQARIDAGA